ncbi:uncharacterized protein [Littorina saxatilis]|uniref:uncharacterized protein n=1 Tax=Littorina saxatilis TaxID=31220 RepID=UPI0038B5177B
MEARSESGDLYKRKTLEGIRYGLNRHLKSPPHNNDFDIVRDSDFSVANEMFKAAVKELKQQGKGNITHYEPMAEADRQKLYHSMYMNTATPTGLANKVQFDVRYYFSRRGAENMHSMTKTTFRIKQTQQQRVCVQNLRRTYQKSPTRHGIRHRIHASDSDRFVPRGVFQAVYQPPQPRLRPSLGVSSGHFFYRFAGLVCEETNRCKLNVPVPPPSEQILRSESSLHKSLDPGHKCHCPASIQLHACRNHGCDRSSKRQRAHHIPTYIMKLQMGDALAIEASSSSLTRTQTVRQVQGAPTVMAGSDYETLDCFFDEIHEPRDESVPQMRKIVFQNCTINNINITVRK